MTRTLKFFLMLIFTMSILAFWLPLAPKMPAPPLNDGVQPEYRDAFTQIPAPAIQPSALHKAPATFIVEYIGFPADARNAFQQAVDIWSDLLQSNVPIRVEARWIALSTNVLGSAGPSGLIRDWDNAPRSGTWYPIALAEKLANVPLNRSDSSDIRARFNSSRNDWYFGTDGNPPAGQFDLVSVVLHELGHGLGFFGSMAVSGTQGSWGSNSGFPFVYDRFTENGNGQLLIDTGIFSNPSLALRSQFTSGNIFFDGPATRAAGQNSAARLFAPTAWSEGSSISHLNESTHPVGTINSLMTPQISSSEAVHHPGPLTLGMFADMGWTVTTDTTNNPDPTPIDEFELMQNQPNPFNQETSIPYRLVDEGEARMDVFDLYGRPIRSLLDGFQTPGSSFTVWDGLNDDGQPVASGIYFYRLQSGNEALIRKMVLSR